MTAALQLADAANVFGISRDTLRRRLDEGAIPEARWGVTGWEFPTESLKSVAQREGWPLDLTGQRASTADIPSQLDRYISETVAAHAALVLAKTQAAAARAEAQELTRDLAETTERLSRSELDRQASDHLLDQARDEVQQLKAERDTTQARLEEIRQELAYERSRSAFLHQELNRAYDRQAELVSTMGPLGRWRYRSKPLVAARVG